MKKITEIETKIPIPTGMLREVINRFGILGRNNYFFCKTKEDIYFRDEHNDIGYNNKILGVRSIVESIPCDIKNAGNIFTDYGINRLEENDIESFLSYTFDPTKLKHYRYITTKIKNVEKGFEHNLEQEVSINDNLVTTCRMLDILGFKTKFSKSKFSIFYTLELDPFNVEIVYVSRNNHDKNGVWYVEIESTEKLQCIMGTYDWKIDDYEDHICDIIRNLGLDPSTKDNRNWKDILGIESE